MQLISSDQKVIDNTIQDLKEFNNQSLSTQAKKGEQRKVNSNYMFFYNMNERIIFFSFIFW